MAAKRKGEPTRACGYLRKSTAGEDAQGRERQEKSLPRQKVEVVALAKRDGLEVVVWLEDSGVSGWKRGKRRPGFERMCGAAEKGEFEAIVVEHIDRFSRASLDEVLEDATRLAKAGVKRIVTPGDVFPLEFRDLVSLMRFAIAVDQAHKYSRNLSRRISGARRNRALQGKRNGAPEPFGMELDGGGGLKAKAGEARWVREMYGWFTEGWSLCAIARELNRKGVRTKRGKEWRFDGVRAVLGNAAYVGDLTWNRKPGGRWSVVNKQGVVTDREDYEEEGMEAMTVVTKDRWPGLVERRVWDRAQKMLKRMTDEGRKPRKDGAALSGGLVRCGVCGKALTGCRTKKRGGMVYRCSGPCSYQIRETVLLKLVVENVREALGDLGRFDVRRVKEGKGDDTRERDEERRRLERDVERLTRNLGRFEGDDGTFRTLCEEVQRVRERLKEVEAERDEPAQAWTREDQRRYREWLREALDGAVLLPTKAEDAEDDLYLGGQPSDPRRVNEALHGIGTRLTVWMERGREKCRNGKTVVRWEMKRARLQLGMTGRELTGREMRESQT